MTDMKISDGAVIVAHRLYWATDSANLGSYERMRHTIAAALTYYAAHPDKLPQEVRDAVRGMDRDKPSKTH